MPPEAIVAPVAAGATAVSVNININIEKHIHPHHWVFVEEKYVLEPVHTHIVIAKKSDWILNVTRPSTHIVVEAHGRVVDRSLAVKDVERASGRIVRPVHVREVDAAVSTDVRATAKADELVVPRAKLRPITETRTSSVATTNPPVARTPIVRQPVNSVPKTAAGTVKTTDAKAYATTVNPSYPATTGNVTVKDKTYSGANGAAASTPAVTPMRGTVERKPRPESVPVPAEKSSNVTQATTHVKSQGPLAAVPAGSVTAHHTDANQVTGQEVKDANGKRVVTRRGAASNPAPTVSGDASSRVRDVHREADPARDRVRTNADREHRSDRENSVE